MQTSRQQPLVFSFRSSKGIHLYHYDQSRYISRFALIVNDKVHVRHDIYSCSEYEHLVRCTKDFNDNCIDIKFNKPQITTLCKHGIKWFLEIIVTVILTVFLAFDFIVFLARYDEEKVTK